VFDRETDGQTDRIILFAIDRVCIPCSAVKMVKIAFELCPVGLGHKQTNNATDTRKTDQDWALTDLFMKKV